MRYFAQVCDAYDEDCDQFGTDIDIETFARLYCMKLYDSRIKTLSGMDAAFTSAARKPMLQIRDAIQQYEEPQVRKLG